MQGRRSGREKYATKTLSEKKITNLNWVTFNERNLSSIIILKAI